MTTTSLSTGSEVGGFVRPKESVVLRLDLLDRYRTVAQVTD
jgi:hypothetical protein